MKARFFPLFLAAILLSGCAANRIFYFPNAKLYVDPDKIGVACELVTFPSGNGKILYGLYFNSEKEPIGTVVHFHGNANNVSDHFPLALFLRKYGFDLLCFDYQGFGASQGHPSPENTVEDGLAALRYARSRMRASPGGVVVFGQSLGAAVAAVAAAKDPGVKAAVLESGFNSYRAITGDVMRRSWLLFLFSPIFPPLFVRKTWDPDKFIAQISPRPVLIIHGTADKVVPWKFSRKLFDKAREPRELWLVEGAGHLQIHRKAGKTYEEKIASFFRKALES